MERTQDKRKKTAQAFEWFDLISKGFTQKEIAQRYGVRPCSVYQLLARHKLPTDANSYLKWLNSRE